MADRCSRKPRRPLCKGAGGARSGPPADLTKKTLSETDTGH
jgi:hypothetical protein